MSHLKPEYEQELFKLFHGFIDNGLSGRFDEAYAFVSDKYTGVGMGEQGLVQSKERAIQLLKDSFSPEEGSTTTYTVKSYSFNMLSDDVALLSGEVIVATTSIDNNVMHSGLLQTIVACLTQEGWRISFTQASPSILSAQDTMAYPIRFMDKTISSLKAELKTQTALPRRDALTGVLNREGLELGAKALMKDYNPKYITALFMIDLDDFKQINDRLGHQVGDTVLKRVASALTHTFRESDVIGRLGGDEFMIVLSGDFSVTFLENKADELLKAVHVHLDDRREVPVSISIGVAYGRAHTTFDKLYRIADIALYTAKKGGKCRYHLINLDTNAHHNFSGSSAKLMSLQTLLDYSNTTGAIETKTPYEALLENIPGGVVMFELIGDEIKATHCNDWIPKLLGYEEKEFVLLQTENPFALIHESDIDGICKSIKAIKNGADNSNVTYRIRHKNGSFKHVNRIVSVTERRRDSITMYGIESDVEGIL